MRQRFDKFVDRHSAKGIAVIRERWMLKLRFKSNREVRKGDLELELGKVPIISFEKLEIVDQPTLDYRENYKE